MQPNQPSGDPHYSNDYPNQSAGSPQYSIDYLNQIAPSESKKSMNNKLFFLLIGGLLLVAIVVGLLAAMSGFGGGNGDKLQTLAVRVSELQKVTNEAADNITSNQLQSTNSNLNIQLTNAARDLTTALTKKGIDVKKIDPKIVARESNAELTANLEEARLNAIYDRVYAREMNYQLATIFALMKEIGSETNSESLKKTLSTMLTNLEPVQTQLANFNESAE